MAFSVFVEVLNLKAGRKRASPVNLHAPYAPEPAGGAAPPGAAG